MQPIGQLNNENISIRSSFLWYVFPVFIFLVVLFLSLLGRIERTDIVKLLIVGMAWIILFGCRSLTVRDGMIRYRSFLILVRSVRIDDISSAKIEQIKVWWSCSHLTPHLVIKRNSAGSLLVPTFLPEEKLQNLADVLNGALAGSTVSAREKCPVKQNQMSRTANRRTTI